MSIIKLKSAVRIAHTLGNWLGSLLYVLPNPIQRTVLKNLTIAYADMPAAQRQQLLKQNLQQVCQSLLESFVLWKAPQAQAIALVQDCQNWHLVEQALQQQRGIIFLTPHLGCFEITSMYYAAHHPITVLFRQPKLAWLRKIIMQGRQQPGVKLAPANQRGVRLLLQALQHGEAIGILPDQTPSKAEGEWAAFYGKPAYTMTLVSKLALKSQAQVIMAFGERLPNSQGYVIHLKALTTQQVSTPALLNQAVQAQIEVCPSQYFWAYDRYKASRKALKKLSVKG